MLLTYCKLGSSLLEGKKIEHHKSINPLHKIYHPHVGDNMPTLAIAN